jgi:hypothetical protein
MPLSPLTGLPIVTEDEAEGEIAELYREVKRVLHMPIVPNFMTALGASAPALKFWTILTETMIETLTLPQAFQPIIFYAVAAHANCEYCSASNEVQCRMLGMDEDT